MGHKEEAKAAGPAMEEMGVFGKSGCCPVPASPKLAGMLVRKTAAFESHANPANMQSVRRASS